MLKPEKFKKNIKLSKDIKKLRQSLLTHLTSDLAKDMYSATSRDKLHAVILSVRENIVQKWINTQQKYYDVDSKRVYYLSLEFLLGRLLENYILNIGMSEQYSRAADILQLNFENILEQEWDFGLGNGGLGRLAACFLDSMATLRYPGYGYGIRYEYGIFSQKIKEGYQIESPDNWLRYGNFWEFPRPELLYQVRFHGRVAAISGADGKFRMDWTDTENVMAMAYDYPVPGFQNNIVNTLRLWAAKSTREFNFEYFNSGDYIKAVESKSDSESISKVLYPSDQSLAGKALRLKQQYFFVCATLKDIIRRYKKFHRTYDEFPDKNAVQLNDTHPSIAIPELMRILVDEERMPWDDAWAITTKTFAYTNHTVLPEALETWSEKLMEDLLPRHLQIIHEIDRRLLVQVEKISTDNSDIKEDTAIITGSGERYIHMARLAIAGSHAVNGVSELHSNIIKTKLFKSFYSIMPEKFYNVTNGITPRRWLLQANPLLSRLITDVIGDGWMKNLEELRKLKRFAKDGEFCSRYRKIKKINKETLLAYLGQTFQLSFPPEFLLDSQIKRFHEYKRQLLNILHVITLYNKIREQRVDDSFIPRTVLFAGKSAPGYFICKLIIKLIHNVSSVISADPDVQDKLNVLFIPNYSVSAAQRIIPATELSEQISTAGYEASGTGNMKFALNGALTIGTLDGANIEIREEAGSDNFFLFGLTADKLSEIQPVYNPRQCYEENKELRKAIDQIYEGHFSPEDRRLFHPIVNMLLENDRFFVLADYDSYISCQEQVSKTYKDTEKWTKMSIHNIACSGKFNSDRAITEYAEKIWKVYPVSL